MRFKIIRTEPDEVLFGGYYHTLIDTKRQPGHILYERGIRYSRSPIAPEDLRRQQALLNTREVLDVTATVT